MGERGRNRVEVGRGDRSRDDVRRGLWRVHFKGRERVATEEGVSCVEWVCVSFLQGGAIFAIDIRIVGPESVHCSGAGASCHLRSPSEGCGRRGSWAGVPTRATEGSPVVLTRDTCRRPGLMHRTPPLSRRCWTWPWRSRSRRPRRTSGGGSEPSRQRTRRSRVAYNPKPSGRRPPPRGRPGPRPSPSAGAGGRDNCRRIRIRVQEVGHRRLPGRLRGAGEIPRARVLPRDAGGVGVPSAQAVSWAPYSALGVGATAASSLQWGGSGTQSVFDVLDATARWRTHARARPRSRCTRASRCTRSASETCTILGAVRAATSFRLGVTA